MQSAITKAFIKSKSKNETMPQVVRLGPDMSLFFTICSTFAIFGFGSFCSYTVLDIVTEKEMQLLETMKIMGLSCWMHWTSWFLRNMIQMSISASLIVALLAVNFLSQPKSQFVTLCLIFSANHIRSMRLEHFVDPLFLLQHLNSHIQLRSECIFFEGISCDMDGTFIVVLHADSTPSGQQ